MLLGTVSAISAHAQSMTRTMTLPEVVSLDIDGNASLGDRELKAAMVTEPSRCKFPFVCAVTKRFGLYTRHPLDRAELDRDVLRLRVLYWKHGWRAAQVTPVVRKIDEGRVAVRLEVVEGPTTTIGTLQLGALDSLLSPREKRQLVTLQEGATLNVMELDSIAVRVAAALDRKGFGDATVGPVAEADTASPRAAVRFDLQHLYRTRVESIRVAGTELFDPRLVENTMHLKAGDPYTRIGTVESQRALYSAGFFRRAVVQVLPGSADSLKRLVASVEELPPRSMRITGGVSTTDFVQLDARFVNTNFRGRAGRLTLQGTIGNLLGTQLVNRGLFTNVLPTTLSDSAPKYLQPTFQLNADIRRRSLSDYRNTIGFSLFGYRRSSPGVFVDQGGGAAAIFTRNVTPFIPVSAQYRVEFTNVSAADAYYCVNFGVCDQPSLAVVRRTQRLAPFVLSAVSDRRDNPIAPTRGRSWRAEVELADTYTGSQLRYGRIELEGATYLHLSENATLAFHVHGGIVKGRANAGDLGRDVAVVHPRKRFYTGGARSVRGYGENQLGPRILVIPRSVFQPTQARYDSLLADPTQRLPCDPKTPLAECGTEPTDAARPATDFTDSDFTPKPLGAETMVEGSIEGRYHFWGPLTAALFIDAGSVGSGLAGTTSVITPGFGIRYLSPVGPIRVDLGYNPRRNDQLQVVTELDPLRDGASGLFLIKNTRSFNPANGTGLGGIFNRFTIHLSIGEAF